MLASSESALGRNLIRLFRHFGGCSECILHEAYMNARRMIRLAVPVGVMLIAAVITAGFSNRLHGSHHYSTWYIAVGLL